MLTLSGGRSSRGSGMRRSISRAGCMSVVMLVLSGAGADDLPQRRVVHVHLHSVDFVPRKAKPFEFALERGLVLRLVDGDDEAAEHVDPHLLECGVNAFEHGGSVALQLVAR